jgi:hypothetical protein
MTGTVSTATISLPQDISTTATVTFGNIIVGPGGFISFEYDNGVPQYNRASRHFTNDSTEPFESWLPGDTYYDNIGENIYIMVETRAPVRNLPVVGNAGDTFLITADPAVLNIYPNMAVAGVGIGQFCTVSDPPYSGPDGSGNYQIDLVVPNDSAVTTATFVANQLLDITVKL